MIILNDLHLGVSRKAGVTPASSEALRTYIFEQFRRLLNQSKGEDLLIAGDLFDQFEVAPRDWFETYFYLSEWLYEPGNKLTLVAGNHDHSPKAARMSSFRMLAGVLDQQHGDSVRVIDTNEYACAAPGVWAVAHHDNQDMFDVALKALMDLTKDGDFLVLHANYDNKFAEQSDHSLNVSNDVARDFGNKGVHLVFAHEHQHRSEIPVGANATHPGVTIMGNQFPTSVSDCLGNDQKRFHFIDRTSDGRLGIGFQACWHHYENGFIQIDWHDLDEEHVLHNFIRITGEATAAEASEVINTIHRFRQKCSADVFVVSNAVKVDGIVESEELPEAFEAANTFDVLDYIYKQLEPTELKVVQKIVEGL